MDNNSTDLVMKDVTANNVFKNLEIFDSQMPDNFVRIHPNYIVNINYVFSINYNKSTSTLKLRKLQLSFSNLYKSKVDELNKKITKSVIL